MKAKVTPSYVKLTLDNLIRRVSCWKETKQVADYCHENIQKSFKERGGMVKGNYLWSGGSARENMFGITLSRSP